MFKEKSGTILPSSVAPAHDYLVNRQSTTWRALKTCIVPKSYPRTTIMLGMEAFCAVHCTVQGCRNVYDELKVGKLQRKQ